MEKAKGKVLSTDNDIAEVLITRGSMCGDNCSNCGMCENKGTKVLAKNTVGAKAGELVTLEVATSVGLKAAVLVYLIPVFVFIVSVVLFSKTGFEEGKAVLCSFLIMAVWFACVFAAERLGVFKNRIYAKIVSKEA